MVKWPLQVLGSGTSSLWSVSFGPRPVRSSVSLMQVQTSRVFVVAFCAVVGAPVSDDSLAAEPEQALDGEVPPQGALEELQ